MKNLDENISMNQREKIQASIELLSIIRDNIIMKNGETYNTKLLMWLIDQLKESLLILNTIPTDE